MNNRGISSTILALILFILFLNFIVWSGLLFPSPYYPYMDYGASIAPTIYSSEHNIGVLNELATFEINVWSIKSIPLEFEIIITAEDDLISNTNIPLDANTSRNETITLRLEDVGMWKVKAIQNQTTVDSYSFETLINKEEADERVAAYTPPPEPLPIELMLKIITTVGSVITVTVTLLKYKKAS